MPNAPSIPEPYASIGALHSFAVATKEAVETLNGQRCRTMLEAAVTWGDLVALGLVKPEQVPKRPGEGPIVR